MRAADRRTAGVFNTGQKRQRSPSDETERKIKVQITSSPVGGYHVLEISNIIPSRKKPKHIARRSNNTYQPNRTEDLKLLNQRRTLHSTFKTLKEEMDALQVVRILKENGLIDENFYKKFKDKRTRQERVEVLLTEIDRLMTEDDDVRKLQIFPGLVKALEESYQDELVTALQTPSQIQEFKCTGTGVNDMFRFFHHAKDKIIETIEPRRFIDDVVTIHGIDLQDYEDITSKSEREDRARELLLKITKAQMPLKIIKPMCDCYSDLYSQFKNSEKSETASINEIGTPVAARYTFQETVAQEDTNENSHPMTEIKKLQQRIVDNTNDNPEQFDRLQEEISNDTSLLLSRLSLSSVKFHLRTTSSTSLEELKECCRNGKPIAWLMSLLKPDDIEKLKELQSTNGKLECYIDDEDPKKQLFDEAFEECFCVLSRETFQSNICLFQDEWGGLEFTVIDTLLDSKTLDVTLAKSLSHVKDNAAKLGTKHVLAKLLQQETVPRTCFCIIERELMRNMKCATIQQLQRKIPVFSGLKDVTTVVKENLKDKTDLLEEELDARWFLATLKSRTEEKYVRIVQEIEKSRSRKSRTKPFVKFLSEEEDVEWFVKELEECNPHVLEVLSHQKSSKEASVFRNAMLCIYDFIINEVEPLELKSHLKASCMEQLRYGDMEKINGRRERAFFLMKQLFANNNSDRVLDVMDAFSSKYANIEKTIKDVSRNGSTCEHYQCPRIEKHLMKMSKYIFTADFTLMGLEKTDTGLVMQPPKCQLLKFDILPQELCPDDKLVVVSNDEDISKEMLLKENECTPSDVQAIEASADSCCVIQTTAKTVPEIPEKCSSEVRLSSETKRMPFEDSRTLKADDGIDKEQRQREMRIKAEKSQEENLNNTNATSTKISLYKQEDHNKILENIKLSILEGKELEMSNDDSKQTIAEPFPALPSTPNYEKQLPSERSSLEYENEYRNDHLEEPMEVTGGKTNSGVQNETSEQNKPTNEAQTNIPMNKKMKPVTSEMSKVQNDQFAVDLQKGQGVKLQNRSLNQIKNTTASLRDTETVVINTGKSPEPYTETRVFVFNEILDQTVNKCSRSATSDSHKPEDSSQKSSFGSQLNKNSIANSAPMTTTKSTTETVGGKAEPVPVYQPPVTPKLKLKRKRKSHEFHPVRYNAPVSYNDAVEYQRRLDIERERWHFEESWYRYCYNEWLWEKRMQQPIHQPPNLRRKNNAHNRGYSHPPMRRQHPYYNDIEDRQMIRY